MDVRQHEVADLLGIGELGGSFGCGGVAVD
jgi:hypothetical protein